MFDFFSFLNYLNTNRLDTTYSKIIVYLLTHPNEVRTLTITQLAEKCFVSAATMTRFCRHFGASSFSELREALVSFNQLKPHSSLRMKEAELTTLRNNPEAYLQMYGQEIITAIQDVTQTMDIPELDQLLADIHQAESVLVIGYSSTLELAKEMQATFFSNQKLLFVGENEKSQQSVLEQLTPRSLIIVLSSYGTFLNKSSQLIQQLNENPAKSVLLTQQTKNPLTNLFDQVINVTSTSYVKIGSYPLSFFLDYLVRRYASLYQRV